MNLFMCYIVEVVFDFCFWVAGHWQNGFVESFNGKFRDECLSREWFLDRMDAKVLIEKWRHFYNHERPHSALSNKTPAEVSGSSNSSYFTING